MEDVVVDQAEQIVEDSSIAGAQNQRQGSNYPQTGMYRLQSGDKLQILFEHTPDQNFDVNVRIDGAVSTPYGEIFVDGMSVVELEQKLAELYSIALLHPRPVVRLLEIAERHFYVFGEITKPNKYLFEPGIDLVSAIAIAGGSLRTANLKNVVVMRVNGQNQYTFEAVNLSNLFSDDSPAGPYWLQPRDIVIVTTTLIADIGIFVDQYINTFLPPIDSYTRGRYYWKLISTQD
jgi:protein involved in polysaccharide export with SLBB domain